MRRYSAPIALALTAFAVLASVSCGRKSDYSRYVRISMGPDRVAYLLFEGKELRVAATPEGLTNARPIRASDALRTGSETCFTFEAVALPRPENADAAQGTFRYFLRPALGKAHHVVADITISQSDDEGNTWEYVLQDGASPNGGPPAQAPALHAELDPGRLSLHVVADKAGEDAEYGIMLYLKSGACRLTGVRKNGTPVQATVRVLDDEGDLIASATRPVEQFGFT